MKFYKQKNITIVILLYSLGVFSQQAYFGYIEEPTNSRAIALGSSGTAGSNGGFSFYNPANVGIIDAPFISFEYGMIWGDISRGIIEGCWGFKDWFVGSSFQTQNNTFTLTDATGNYINGATGVEQASMVSIIGGIKRERFSMGLSVNGLHHRIFDLPSSAISLSGGINLSVVPGKLRAGLSIINAGRYHKGFYSSGYELSSDLMPTTGRAGVLWKDTLRNILPVIVYIDAVYEKNYDLVTVPVGVELSPIPYLALRIGKCFFLETELFTSGIGIKWENLSFDASFVPYSIEEETFIKWSVALRYELKRKKQTKESTSQIKIQKETIITPVEEKNDTIFSLPKADTSESDRSKVEEDTLSKSSIKTGEDFNKKEPQQNSLQSDTARAEDSLGVEVPENKTENIREQNFSSPHNKNLPLDTLDVPSKKEDISPLDTLQRENLKKAE